MSYFEAYRQQPLDKTQLQILKVLRAKRCTEKQLSKIIRIDAYPLSSIITDLMIVGYVDAVSRRRFRFFVKKYCVITPTGLAALDQHSTPFENLIRHIKDEIPLVMDSIARKSPAFILIRISGKFAYSILKSLR